MYAVLNDYNLSDDYTGARVCGVYTRFCDALKRAANEIGTIEFPIIPYSDDEWERYEIVEVSDRDEADELLESGDYYDMRSLFHWDTSMLESGC